MDATKKTGLEGVDEKLEFIYNSEDDVEKILKTESEKYTILRPSTVYWRENKLLKMIRRAAPTMFFPNIKTLTQPIHIDDLVSIIEKSLKQFNQQELKLGGREEITVGYMTKRISLHACTSTNNIRSFHCCTRQSMCKNESNYQYFVGVLI